MSRGVSINALVVDNRSVTASSAANGLFRRHGSCGMQRRLVVAHRPTVEAFILDETSLDIYSTTPLARGQIKQLRAQAGVSLCRVFTRDNAGVREDHLAEFSLPNGACLGSRFPKQITITQGPLAGNYRVKTAPSIAAFVPR